MGDVHGHVVVFGGQPQHQPALDGGQQRRRHRVGPVAGDDEVDAQGTAVRGQLQEDVPQRGQPAVFVGLAERRHAVDQHEDALLIRAVGQVPVLDDGGGPDLGEAGGPFVGDVAEQAQQPADAFHVVAVDDLADVRQLLEHLQPGGAAVDAVDVDRAAAGRDGRRDGDAAQGRGLAGAAGAVDGHVAVLVRLVEHRGLVLAGGIVRHAEQQPLVGAGVRQQREVVGRGELVQPRLARRLGWPATSAAPDDVGGHPGDVVGPGGFFLTGLLGAGRFPGWARTRRPSPRCRSAGAAASPWSSRRRSRSGTLDAAGTGLRRAAARDGRVEVRGDRARRGCPWRRPRRPSAAPRAGWCWRAGCP